MPTTRRGFMQGAAALGAASLALPFGEWARHLGAREFARVSGFGPLRPARDEATGLELLELPEGFRYTSFGWAGDELSDGSKTPDSHDGMAVIASDGDTVTLCRNHEVDGPGVAFGKGGSVYDRFGKGGCTNLVFNTKTAKLESSWASLRGTVRNCAGGPTPWGTWLSCEETTVERGDKENSRDVKGLDFEQAHGWVFEVPARGNSEARPIKGMGRFTHEAISFDPASGVIYMTEDQGHAGFYRFIPIERRNLQAGGKVQMLQGQRHSEPRQGAQGRAGLRGLLGRHRGPGGRSRRREAPGRRLLPEGLCAAGGDVLGPRRLLAYPGEGLLHGQERRRLGRRPDLVLRPRRGETDAPLRVPQRDGPRHARQHHDEPPRGPGDLRGRQHRPPAAPPVPDARRGGGPPSPPTP